MSDEPIVLLELRRLVELDRRRQQRIDELVAAARARGISWRRLGEAMGEHPDTVRMRVRRQEGTAPRVGRPRRRRGASEVPAGAGHADPVVHRNPGHDSASAMGITGDGVRLRMRRRAETEAASAARRTGT